MCGIAGSVRGDAPATRRQLSTLHHRGPDSSGSFASPPFIVGQSRLRIIDLVSGDPPISNEDGSVAAVLNGEIYDFAAMRHSLERGGHRFSTGCDTEVICHLAEDLEPVELCRALQGMFAFAVADERRGRLVLGRDRLGKKPLYYWVGPGGDVVFGSEIKAVLADPRVPRALNIDASAPYLTFGYVPSPSTFYEGIESLPPGHVLVADGHGDPTVECYWAPQVPNAGGADLWNGTYEGAVACVREVFTRSVERRMIADVPLGAFLSGGVDSSAVVGVMSGLSSTPVRTFTIGFDDQTGFDERPYARLVADRFGTDHTEFVVDSDRAELVERLVWHHDQPFGDSSALPTFLLSELTAGEVTVALSGDGGDELFAGYERFLAAMVGDRYRRLPAAIRSIATRGAGVAPPTAFGGRAGSVQRLLAQAARPLPGSLLGWISVVPEAWRRRLLPGAVDFGEAGYEALWRESEGAALLDRLLVQNLRTYLLDDLLPKVDRMSMAHALEVRSPFLDAELVELALRLPAHYRIRGLTLKRVFKDAVRDLLPDALLERKKRGFGIPLDRWLRTDLAPFVEAMLLVPSSRAAQHVDGAALRELVLAQRSGGHGLGHAVWALLTLEVFLRRERW